MVAKTSFCTSQQDLSQDGQMVLEESVENDWAHFLTRQPMQVNGWQPFSLFLLVWFYCCFDFCLFVCSPLMPVLPRCLELQGPF